MILHQPFFIGARLAPCLGLYCGAKLSLLGGEPVVRPGENYQRLQYSFVIDFDDGRESYVDDRMTSGCGGGGGTVYAFENFLGFLLAAVESYEYEQRNPGSNGENTDLFPLHIVQWASENKMDIEGAWCDVRDPETGDANDSLIEE